MKKLFVLAFCCLAVFLARGTTFTVTNTNDSGTGSLRQAISDANAYPGSHTIAFNIPQSDPNYISAQGVWKITPQSKLPFIMKSNLMIDGTTQTTNRGNTNPDGPEILLDGNHLYDSDFAFHIYNVSGVTIKGFIIGRFTAGIQIVGTNAQNNTITGNYIGCNYNGTDTLGNTYGIEVLPGPHNNIIGGTTLAERNIISGNIHIGIRLTGSNSNVIKGNFVGLNRTGNAALGNDDGITIEATSKYNIVGGLTGAERNYISGNNAYGLFLYSEGTSYNVISGNYIGTDVGGTFAIPNTYGVLFDGGSSYNLLGGRAAGAGNLLSGNSGYGVFLYNPGSQCDTLIGNLIGTDYTGTVAVPNANGIVIDGPSFKHIIDGNVISGNSQMGISIHIGGSDSNIVINNKIGTDITGTLPLPNAIDGIRIAEGPHHNIIGQPGKGNIIAFNGGNGITIMTAADLYNTISCNSIFNNSVLGIDLYPAGPDANDQGDVDTGPNGSLNYPVIDSVHFSSGSAVVFGHLDVAQPVLTRVELFMAIPDFTGYGEGKTFLGSTFPKATGLWCDTVSGLTSTDFITATATDHDGNTSEFSFDYPTPPVMVFNYDTEPVRVIVAPNPFSESTQITVTAVHEAGTEITAELYNASGKLVRTVMTDQGIIDIDGSSLAAGLYFCHLKLKDKELPVMKVIKK